MDKSNSGRRPSFFWQGLMILLPVLVLAVVGLYSLRQDEQAAEQAARKKAAENVRKSRPRHERHGGRSVQSVFGPATILDGRVARADHREFQKRTQRQSSTNLNGSRHTLASIWSLWLRPSPVSPIKEASYRQWIFLLCPSRQTGFISSLQGKETPGRNCAKVSPWTVLPMPSSARGKTSWPQIHRKNRGWPPRTMSVSTALSETRNRTAVTPNPACPSQLSR